MVSRQAPELHTSELKAFKECRRRWAISEIAHIQPVRPSMALVLGTAIHAAGEAWHGQDDYDAAVEAFHNAFDEELKECKENTPWIYAEVEESVLENIELGLVMLDGYVNHWNPEEFRIAKAGGKPLLEVPFSMPVLTPAGKPYKNWIYTGTMDGIVIDDYGVWILERKTTTRTNPDYLRLDDQNVMYMAYAMKQWPKLQDKIRGVKYDFWRKQRPGPRVKSPLFFRENIFRNKHEVHNAQRQVFYVTQEIERVTKDPHNLALPTASDTCSWKCSYKPLCMAMNDGTDVATLIEASYCIKQGRMKMPLTWDITEVEDV